MQSKLSSLVEAALNTASGFVISVATSALVFPMFGVHLPLVSNIKIVAVFTIVSIVRSYFWRRYFNKRTEKANS